MSATIPSLLALAAACLAGCASPPDPFEHAKLLGRGINLGDALEAPAEGDWGIRLKADYFRLIRSAGFDTVRIPVCWSAHADGQPPWRISEDFFTRVDWAVRQALAHNLRVVVDMHHYDELMKDPAGHRDRFLGLWRQISERFRGYPPELYFEILNEPCGELTTAGWDNLLASAVAVIRQAHPRRTLIVNSRKDDSGVLTDFSLPPADRNLIASFHYYKPFRFTHQGAEWLAGAESALGRTWSGTAAQRQAVIADLDRVVRWGREHERPLWMGEFGTYDKADLDSRAAWTSFVSREAEKRGIMWAYWDFGGSFGIYDPAAGEWRTVLLKALLPDGN